MLPNTNEEFEKEFEEELEKEQNQLLVEEESEIAESAPEVESEALTFPRRGLITGLKYNQRVNVRVEADKMAYVFGTLGNGDVVIVVGETSDFYKIESENDLQGKPMQTPTELYIVKEYVSIS